jgi:hypothetical protein
MGEFGDVDPYESTLLNRVFGPDPRVEDPSPNVTFARNVAYSLGRCRHYHLAIPALKALGTGHPSKRITYYGNGLPDFIAWANSTKEGLESPCYEAILAGMKELIPELDRILVSQFQTEEVGLTMSLRGQRGSIEAADWSDGTLLTLGLLCLVYGPDQPALLCIEEPEAGLNPRRLRWLFDRFIELAYPTDGKEPTQVILSTHSPWFIDLFKDFQDSVLLVEQTQGRSRVTPLVDLLHQEFTPDEPIGHRWAAGIYEGKPEVDSSFSDRKCQRT